MIFPIVGVLFGLVLLLWSADKFVEGSASTAKYFNMPPLLIGMLIVGFGTSAPEMMVSALSAAQGNPGIALGNAYGSNITNIALILGVTALIKPILIHSQVVKKELPILIGVTLFNFYQLSDGVLSRPDAIVLILLFILLMSWTIYQSYKTKDDAFGKEMESELIEQTINIKNAILWIIGGLFFLLLSSKILVWGATEIAKYFGVSDLIIGLTVVALGTSLPELASSVIASRKGEDDIALGNVLGSNLFNILMVIGIAGTIQPMKIDSVVLSRDIPAVIILTLAILVMGFGFRGPSRIKRIDGLLLLTSYLGYLIYLVMAA